MENIKTEILNKKGRGTSLVSIIEPNSCNIDSIINMLKSELQA